jgi:hypothetical protein
VLKIGELLSFRKAYFKLTQNTIYGVGCSICFANLNIHEQEEKPKNNGLKMIDSQGAIFS